MKNYKFLIPIALIALFISSFYMLFDTKSSIIKEYESYLELAREYKEQEIIVDALENYNLALDIEPTLEIYIEVIRMYIDQQETRTALSLAEDVVDLYPKDIESYEILFELYYLKNDYTGCFEILETVGKRGLSSEYIDEMITCIEYDYYFNGSYVDVGVFSAGYCAVFNGSTWGYVNTIGNTTVNNQFLVAGYYSNNLAAVVDSDNETYYIDESGNKKKVITYLDNVAELGFYISNVYSYSDGNKWYFYNEDEELLLGGYEDVTALANGYGAYLENDKWTIIDDLGNVFINESFDDIATDEKLIIYRNERFFVCNDYIYSMLDNEGNVISSGYEDVKIFNDTTYAAVMIDGQWGFIDNTGEVVIEAEYEDARSFANGLAAVKYAGKWGFIDLEGNLVIDTQFDDAKDFTSSGTVFVLDNDEWTLLRLYKYNY